MSGKFDVDSELVRKLAALIEETGLEEIEFAAGDRRIRVARPRAGVTYAAPPAPAEPAKDSAVPVEEGLAVTAPMVGVVYTAPEPGADPFVRVGDAVAQGQTLLLIEAMKTFNPVRSPRDGRIKRILVNDGTPVEFGEELLILE